MVSVFFILFTQFDITLFESKRIVSELFLKSRKSGFAMFGFYKTKKVLKSKIHSFENILQNSRMNIIQIRANFFEFGKLFFPVLIRDGNSIKFVGIASFTKCGVIGFAAQVRH